MKWSPTFLTLSTRGRHVFLLTMHSSLWSFCIRFIFSFARSVTLQNGVPRSPRNSALWGMVTLSTLIPQTWPKWCTGILVNEGGYQWKSDFITSPGKLTFKMFLKFVSSQWAVLSACATKFWQSMGGVWIAKKIRALLFFCTKVVFMRVSHVIFLMVEQLQRMTSLFFLFQHHQYTHIWNHQDFICHLQNKDDTP